MRRAMLVAGAAALAARALCAAYAEVKARELKPGELAVTGPGAYAEAGKTYVLTKDVASATSPIFLGNNVTLDLNGHTLTYASGAFEHIPNGGFEDGLQGWDVSKAPGAKAEDRRWRNLLVGKNVCILPAGQELISPYISLPVANRSYYAMVAVASHQTPVSVYVDDEQGRPVKCEYRFGGNVRPCCPEENRPTQLGGGVVFALVFGQPAGKYRLRIKAGPQDCILDEADIRPALDVGVSIVAKTMPWAYYKCILDGDGCAFFDYTKPGAPGEPLETVPRVTGEGTITIRNGVIRSGTTGVRSWGVQSTADGVKLVIENVKFAASGINTNGVCAPQAMLKNCRFEIDTPWIVTRHCHEAPAVLNGTRASEVTGCEFLGGQGCLAIRGAGTVVSENLFVNQQTVTNHYSLMCDASRARVFRNRFEPKRGSGMYLYRCQDCDVFENTLSVAADEPINEYSGSDYSVNAFRISDYNAPKGHKDGWCENNRIHHNRIRVTGRSFPEADKGYKPMTYGFFVSVGGGANHIHDNEIVVDDQATAPVAGTFSPGRGEALALYVGGSNQGGEFFNNKITANTTPIWIATMYGEAANTKVYGNTITKAANAKEFPFAKLGWWKHVTRNVGFYANQLVGLKEIIAFENTQGSCEYETGWLLMVKTEPEVEVVVSSKDGKRVTAKKADAQGVAVVPLAEYVVSGNGKQRAECAEYVVKAGGKEQAVTMTANREVR